MLHACEGGFITTMNTYFLPTISDILASEGQENDLSLFDAKFAGENNRHRCPGSRGTSRLKAEQEWYGAIATLNQMLDRQKPGQKTDADRANSRSTIPNSCQGLVLSGPSSVLTDPERGQRLCQLDFYQYSRQRCSFVVFSC